ncbi:hypothetical protein OH492_12825 [Vibrio chagasii]|nr:hypothetical protein [Vibrio chagasii]
MGIALIFTLLIMRPV